jgi:hypothetical protein
MEQDMATSKLRRENAAAGAIAKAAAAKEREVEAEVKRVELKRKGAELPARGDTAMDAS